MIELFGVLFGAALGLLAIVPGIHPTIVLAGLLPLLGIHGIFGACAIVGALGSSQAVMGLAKTYHPATQQSMQAATPEQVMAYSGRGKLALAIQTQATWTGVTTVLVLATLLLLFQALTGGIDVTPLIKALSPLLIGLYLVVTVGSASRKAVTLAVVLLGTVVGFYTLNHPALVGNPSSLAPLLGGIFTVAALSQVIFHRGNVQSFPAQRPVTATRWVFAERQYLGALSGLTTAMIAGLGSGAMVSFFAGHVREEEYLGMHTASESANNAFAILLFILVGATHSGAGVALKQNVHTLGLVTGILMILAIVVGLYLGTAFVRRIEDAYVGLVSRLPQKQVAVGVLVLTLAIIFFETGLVGLIATILSACLGLIARLYFVPNQALMSVLVGPVLVYYLGLAGPLAGLLGVVR